MRAHPEPGERVAHFRIVRKLGEGGMGAVFEAEDEKLGRRIALKLLPPELVGSADRRARFLREARAAAAVNHRSIATVHEIGEDGDRVFIAMEYVRGESLRERLERGPLPFSDALRITAEIARGLGRAHAVGVIHRDLKPDNVMLDRDGQVKILDFGVAKSVEAAEGASADSATALPTTQAGRILGTPGYMSPEQARGEKVDGRSDLFSLGALLYELLSGERAFRGNTATALLIAVLQQEPPPLRSARPGTPPAVERLVESCLVKDREQRVASAEQLTETVERILLGLSSAENAATLELAPDALAQARTDDAVVAEKPPVPASPSSVARRAKALVGVGVALGLGAGGVWLARGKLGGDASASRALGPDAVVACPPLEESAPRLPQGWLGAAAASLLCTDLTLALGAEEGRTRVPAELLELPKGAVDDFPIDPYGRPDARGRALDAARRHARWVDGRIEKTEAGFRVSAALHDREGPLAERVEATRPLLREAVFAVVDRWIETGLVVPVAPSAGTREATGCSDLDCLRQHRLSEQILRSAEDHAKACDELARRGGYARWRFAAVCGPAKINPPGLAPESPMGVAIDAFNRVTERSNQENLDVAARLARARTPETPEPVSLELELVEAGLRMVAGEQTLSRSQLDRITERHPRSCLARSFALDSSQGQPHRASVAVAYPAWCPWEARAYPELGLAGVDVLPFARMAVALSEPARDFAPLLAYELLRRRHREEARTFAARYMTGSRERQRTGAYIMALVEANEGRLRAAVDRLRASLFGNEIHSADPVMELTLLSALLLAEVLGTDAELAGDFVERFILTEPPRVERGAPYLIIAQAAMRAPRRLALPALSRIRELVDSGMLFGKGMGDRAYLSGCESFVHGDPKGAVARWRPLAAVDAYQFSLRPEAFDRAGEPELASRIDRYRIERPWRIDLGHVREARRAEKRRDFERARTLAERVIDQWATADAEIAPVREMRALLGRLPAAK